MYHVASWFGSFSNLQWSPLLIEVIFLALVMSNVIGSNKKRTGKLYREMLVNYLKNLESKSRPIAIMNQFL